MKGKRVSTQRHVPSILNVQTYSIGYSKNHGLIMPIVVIVVIMMIVIFSYNKKDS